MAQRPSTYYDWATIYIEEAIQTPDGVIYNDSPNRREPFEEFKADGIVGITDGMPVQYINWLLWGMGLWWRHLDERYQIGDIIFADPSKTEAEVSLNKGGDWNLVGTKATTALFIKVS